MAVTAGNLIVTPAILNSAPQNLFSFSVAHAEIKTYVGG